jgi:predicted nucleic acid-binding protein
MVIVDTSIWIDYFLGSNTPATTWLDHELTRQRIGLIDFILMEILQGIRDGRKFTAVRDELLKLEIFAPHDKTLAILAAKHYRALRARGFTVRKAIDCWIATFCMLEGHELLHNDRDFDLFEAELSLRVVHPH